ncbi:MAG TPA: hypothetical protein VL860_06030, partial [Planctomycetota bacterium]|nr:hypothetical protein [Planctomycetota bacterium]
MRALRPLLFALIFLSAAASQSAYAAAAPAAAPAAPTGQINLKFTLPADLTAQSIQVYAYPVQTPVDRAALNYEQLKAGAGKAVTPMTLHKERLAPLQGLPDEPHISLPPGVYDLAFTTAAGPNAAVWIRNIKILPKSAADVRVTLEAPGSVTGTFKLDASLFSTVDPKRTLTLAGLVRDGHVGAVGHCADANSFDIPNVPPGTYTLVLFQAAEHVLFTQEKVVVESGAAVPIEALVKRTDQTAVTISFTDPDGKYFTPGGAGSLKLVNSGLEVLFPIGQNLAGTMKTMGPGFKDPAKTGAPTMTAPVIFVFPTASTVGQCKLYMTDPKYKSIDGMTITPGRPTLDPAVKEDGDVRIHWPYPTLIHLTDAPADTK